MRTITDHKVNGLNEELEVIVHDEQGQGGACHEYSIRYQSDKSGQRVASSQDISFQNGPVKEFGVNGISVESLLVIVIDRLKGFQSGEFKSRDNACALTHFEEGLMWLQKRTCDRLARGVEGTNQK